ncbi:MFS transporter [Pararhizobium mangrovi]|uniref:MFS transporter n=1 Tax=Pararhizobium mangrovi TaxID=2590452 RepID=A0A506U9L8_9HYPH|nr:MFS transporter [Pararhizobium mangrovi]TPW30228.1 MFS transporter [Pararhizobium mangrovi]
MSETGSAARNGLTASLRGNYALTLAITLFALVPYLFATSATDILKGGIIHDVGLSKTMFSLVKGLGTAGYAFGALLAGDLSQRFPRRPLHMTLTASCSLGWLLSISGFGPITFCAGYILAGLSTGLLLIVALPPAVKDYPASRLPFTAVFINLALFGATAAGPLVGGLVAENIGWRGLFTIFAVVAVLAFFLGLVVIAPEKPTAPGTKFDIFAIVLAFGATVLPFGAVAMLQSTGFASPFFYVPLTLGLILFAAIFIVEDRHSAPLIAVDRMTQTTPTIGTIIASFAGGVFISLLSLSLLRATSLWGLSESQAGIGYWPLPIGAVVAAGFLGLAFKTRFLPLLILFGMLVMIGAGVMLMTVSTSSATVTIPLAYGLLGFGAGATVSPALFLAGLSVPSNALGRVLAFIELVRSVGDFLIGPVLVAFAGLIASGPAPGEKQIVITIGIAVAMGVGTTLFCVAAFFSAYRTLPVPHLERWLHGDEAAIETPQALSGGKG